MTRTEMNLYSQEGEVSERRVSKAAQRKVEWDADAANNDLVQAKMVPIEELDRKDALLSEAAEVLAGFPIYAVNYASPDLIAWYQERAKPFLDKLL